MAYKRKTYLPECNDEYCDWFVKKPGTLVGRSHRRWFELNDFNINYFEKVIQSAPDSYRGDPKSLKGTITLYRSTRLHSTRKVLKITNPDREWTLIAYSEETTKKWAAKLKDIVNSFTRCLQLEYGNVNDGRQPEADRHTGLVLEKEDDFLAKESVRPKLVTESKTTKDDDMNDSSTDDFVSACGDTNSEYSVENIQTHEDCGTTNHLNGTQIDQVLSASTKRDCTQADTGDESSEATKNLAILANQLDYIKVFPATVPQEIMDTVIKAFVDAVGILHCRLAVTVMDLENLPKDSTWDEHHIQEQRAVLMTCVRLQREALQAFLDRMFNEWSIDFISFVRPQLTLVTSKYLQKLDIAARMDGEPSLQQIIGSLVIQDYECRQGIDSLSRVTCEVPLQTCTTMFLNARSKVLDLVEKDSSQNVDKYEQLFAGYMECIKADVGILGKYNNFHKGLSQTRIKLKFSNLVGSPKSSFPGYVVYQQWLHCQVSDHFYALLGHILRVAKGDKTSDHGRIITTQVKSVHSLITKSVVDHGGNFSACDDVSRATIVVDSLSAANNILHAIAGCTDELSIIKVFNGFDSDCDPSSLPTDYVGCPCREVYLKCAVYMFETWHPAELIVSLSDVLNLRNANLLATSHSFMRMWMLKKTHWSYNGEASSDVLEGISDGKYVHTKLTAGKPTYVSPPNLDILALANALASQCCRLVSLNLAFAAPCLQNTIIMATLALGLQKNDSLQIVSLRGNGITNNGISDLAKHIAGKSRLKSLDLRDNSITDDGAFSVVQHCLNMELNIMLEHNTLSERTRLQLYTLCQKGKLKMVMDIVDDTEPDTVSLISAYSD